MYTVRPTEEPRKGTLRKLATALGAAVKKDGRFTAQFLVEMHEVHVRNVRLHESKPYCGQHAGPCDIPRFGPRTKKSMKLLEWLDWQEFNGLVNDVLDRAGVSADCWSEPHDTALDKGRKLWVRRGMRRRVRYDFEFGFRRAGLAALYIANHGDDSQFAPEKEDEVL